MMGLGVILTAPVFPMLFYGQEMLSYATFNFPAPPLLDWGLVKANAGILQVVLSIYYYSCVIQEVKDMIALRLNKSGKTLGLSGNHTSILMVIDNANDKIAVYLRSVSGLSAARRSGDVLVVVNMYEAAHKNFAVKNIPTDGVWNVRFNGDLTEYSSLYDNFGSGQSSMTVSGGTGILQLPKYSILVLSQD